MRASEFLTEADLNSIHDGLDIASLALPSAYVIPELKNQDFYKQYRFGVAIAAVRGDQNNDQDKVRYTNHPTFKSESSWNEDQVVVSYDPNVGEVIDKALKKMNLPVKKKEVATAKSDELSDTTKISPIKPFNGYKK